MKNWKRILVVSLVVSSLFATQAFATPSVGELRDDKANAEKEIKNLEDELSGLASQMASLEEDLVTTGQKIIETEAELKEAEENEKQQYESMKLRIKAMYENGTGNMLQKVFESGSLTEMLVQAEHVQTVHEYDRKMLEEYVKTKDKIAKMKEELEAEQDTLLARQEEYKDQQSKINQMIAEKEDEISDLASKIQRAVASANRKKNNYSSTNYVPPANTGGGSAIVNAAYNYLGVPYVWGGASSSGVDCSGLVLLAHRAIGVRLSHFSGSIGSGGQRVPSMAQALPGDVVCYVGHVGIYIGGGQMIHAPQTGDVVRIVNVYGSPWFRRYW